MEVRGSCGKIYCAYQQPKTSILVEGSRAASPWRGGCCRDASTVVESQRAERGRLLRAEVVPQPTSGLGLNRTSPGYFYMLGTLHQPFDRDCRPDLTSAS